MSSLFPAVRRAALLCLPFAAVFAAGVTLSPHASADYPGGSGYPGGGSGGSYPGAGWHPLKPDGTPPRATTSSTPAPSSTATTGPSSTLTSPIVRPSSM